MSAMLSSIGGPELGISPEAHERLVDAYLGKKYLLLLSIRLTVFMAQTCCPDFACMRQLRMYASMRSQDTQAKQARLVI